MTDLPNLIDPRDLRPLSTVEADAVVIGTGAGGAVVARELAEAGLSVAVLEEGDYLDARRYGRATPLESVRLLYRKGGLTFTMGNRAILLPVGRCVGGTTVINSGTTLRAVPWAVERWRGEFRLTDLADHLDRLYARVERTLPVRPVAPENWNRAAELFRSGAERLGYHGAVLTRNELGCRGAARCFLGCPNDAKRATHLSYIPRALARGARLHVRTEARKIQARGGRVQGVWALARRSPRLPGLPVYFRAPAVFVCAGALFTPRLVARARGASGSGIGRRLKVHPATRVVGLFDSEVRGWEGVPQSYHVDEFFREGISIEGVFLPPGVMGAQIPGFGLAHREAMERYNHLAMLGVRIIEEAEGRVAPDFLGLTRSWPLVTMNLLRSDIERLRKGCIRSAQIYFAAGARRVFTGIHGFEILDGPADLKRLAEAPLGADAFELSGYHCQGTARLADDPARGAADPFGRVWGVRGLYVADASALPSSPVANPQLSIQAFATHVAEYFLRERGLRLVEEEPPHAHQPVACAGYAPH